MRVRHRHVKRMITGKINIKPMSVNRAWQGQRFKSRDYLAYEKECLYKLRGPELSITGALGIVLVFGVSSKLADPDNPVKPFLDILQKKFKFNDNQIYSMIVRKVDVKKGFEFVEYRLLRLDDFNLMAPQYLTYDPEDPDGLSYIST